eukprot:GHVS01039080.1.p1 GENE.GHVS01039080.1~~GHVS01039080.1.p1  ORF type:complete len:168 (+),score=12.13 GHVS01039080.1:301-804(+)
MCTALHPVSLCMPCAIYVAMYVAAVDSKLFVVIYICIYVYMYMSLWGQYCQWRGRHYYFSPSGLNPRGESPIPSFSAQLEAVVHCMWILVGRHTTPVQVYVCANCRDVFSGGPSLLCGLGSLSFSSLLPSVGVSTNSFPSFSEVTAALLGMPEDPVREASPNTTTTA